MTDIHLRLDPEDKDSQQLKQSDRDDDTRRDPEAADIVVEGCATVEIDDGEVRMKSDGVVRVFSEATPKPRTGDTGKTAVRLGCEPQTEPVDEPDDTPWRVDGFVG
jgi:hypothetical protein